MLGNRGPEHIVDADEPIQESRAVEDRHGDVPKGGDGQGQEQASEQFHMGQGPKVPVPGQVDQDDQPWQHQSQWPFGQDGQAGQGVGAVIKTGPGFPFG